MSKSWIRSSREINSLTNELNQMKRELEILRWFVAGVIILLSLQFIWMIRMRRSQSNGRTDSPSGTSVETISAQSSPTESPVMSPRCEAANPCVRVSNDGPSPSAQTVKYRRHVNVTPTVPQENLLPCFHRSHQLLPGSNAVSVYLTCLDCRHHAKWTHQTGPTFQEFPELQRMAWSGQNCKDGEGDMSSCADGGSNFLPGSGGTCVSCG